MMVDEPEEWADKLARNIRDEIIGYFEQRFTAMEDQILDIHRYLIVGHLLDVYNQLYAQYTNAIASLQSLDPKSRPNRDNEIKAYQNCLNHIEQRYKLVGGRIRKSRQPETVWQEAVHQ